MHNILVTGGAGFIGSNFIRFIQKVEKEAAVFNLDALTYAGSMQNLEDLPALERHTFIKGDICDNAQVDQILHQYKIDTIVHFAAESHVDRSISSPEKFIQTNVLGTFALLEASRQYWLVEKAPVNAPIRFHHISTDEVFGSLALDDPAWTESVPYAPNSPYAASKASSDHLVRAYSHTYGLPCTITNCSNNYGPYQFPEKLIPLIIANALEGKPLPVYGDGGQIRDWLYVEDHCKAIWMVLAKGVPGETYNVGGGVQPTNLVLVNQICAILDEFVADSPYAPHNSLIRYVPDRLGHDRRYAIDSTKIQRDLGWQPRQSLNDGLKKTVRWYLSNREWMKAIVKQQEYRQWVQTNYSSR